VYQENPRANWRSQTGSGGRFKDVHQDPAGNIEIYDGVDGPEGSKTPTGIFFVSVGQPLRALKWLEKYNKDGGKAIIRRYSVPAGDYEALVTQAVPERGARKIDSINVDVHAATDQFGLRDGALALLRRRVVRNSLVSYTDHPESATSAVSGKLLAASELRKRLGVPETGRDNMDVFLSRSGDFQNRNRFEGIADALMNIYGLWWRNDEYLSDRLRGMLMPARMEWARRELEKRKVKVDAAVWRLVMEVCGGSWSPGRKGISLIEWRLTA
jgi:hypothetical protein